MVSLAQSIRGAFSGLAVSDAPPDRLSYARDLWPRHHIGVTTGRLAASEPGAIVWPRTSEEVAAVVAFCAREGIPVVPYGAGSGVCGGILPDARTVVLDLKRLARWRRFDPERGLLDVEAGAVGIRLEEDLQRRGHTVGHFPSSILCSTVGGWVAARGAGQTSGRYGKIEDMVASLECVDGRGELATLRRRTLGPDVTPLVIGSEGVLCVVTSVGLRLHRAPAHRAFAAYSFADVARGAEAIRTLYQAGLRPAVCRLYDPFDSALARRGTHRATPAEGHAPDAAEAGPRRKRGLARLAPGAGAAVLRQLLRRPGALNGLVDGLGARLLGGSTLVLVFEGEREQAEDERARAHALARGAGAKDLGEAPARHWLEHRYSVSYRQAPMFMAGTFADTMEVSAPWSCLLALYAAVRHALSPHVFVMAHMSHAYPDGCSIYFTFAGTGRDPADAEARYDRTWRAAMTAALEAGGTLSHHHGVGRSKAPMLGAELGHGVAVVGALRQAWDPAGILNPGNLMPRAGDPGATVTQAPTVPPPHDPTLDPASQLVHASGATSLAVVERVLAAHDLTLGLAPATLARGDDTTVAAWLADGAPGAADPWLDPVDHLVAGFSARLPSGAELALRPAPRRAVGPDLYALFHGTRERVGRLTGAYLRAHARGAAAAALPVGLERNPSLDAAEGAFIERALAAARLA
ncbi:MAG: FAD-binding oxidoreductase [Polyangiaceae bacterium]|nr:FAD-binding oxidoreductase [Polyangiaceae bacterium]